MLSGLTDIQCLLKKKKLYSENVLCLCVCVLDGCEYSRNAVSENAQLRLQERNHRKQASKETDMRYPPPSRPPPKKGAFPNLDGQR